MHGEQDYQAIQQPLQRDSERKTNAYSITILYTLPLTPVRHEWLWSIERRLHVSLHFYLAAEYVFLSCIGSPKTSGLYR